MPCDAATVLVVGGGFLVVVSVDFVDSGGVSEDIFLGC